MGRTEFLNMQRSKHQWVQKKSKIQGWGLCARQCIEKGTFIIEYIGELIRSELTDMRELKYNNAGLGCYMFRLDDDWIVDATMRGNAARFVNHSCEPNCVSLITNVEGKELCYDYKFAMEDAKIPCRCGSQFCRTVMN